mgnify:CR=1 FL=1
MKLPKYKYLLTYRYAEIIHDLTVLFCQKYLSDLSNLSNLGQRRTVDQMIQAARSTKQNIVEGVSQSTSLKGQIKLLGVAKASIEELTIDYEDFLRQRKLPIYPKTHLKIFRFRKLGYQLSHLSNLSPLGTLIEKPKLYNDPVDDANFLLTLCHQLSYLLERQIKSVEKRFIQEGGYTENLFHKRLKILKKLNSLKTEGFTLLESLIIIALLALILTAALVLFKPKKQIEKTWDGKRKNELGQLKKVLEDWYNDKNCYPKPQDICYDSPQAISDGTYSCHICGNESSSPSFSPYLSKLPCDPQQPTKRFLYQIDNLNCPSYYRIYTRLSFHQDPAVKEVGCQNFCGPANEPQAYNYGVTSPNTGLEGNETRSIYYCSEGGNCTFIEQNCPPNQIKICNPSYGDPNCGGSGCPQQSNCECENL